jgi:hypothetical protein
MKAAIDLIQVAIAVFIMIVLIYITVASAETAIIRPKNPMMGEVVEMLRAWFA